MKKPIFLTIILILLALNILFPIVMADQVDSNDDSISDIIPVREELPELDMAGMYTDIELIEIDPEITNATEDWMVLAHDDDGRRFLMDDIDNSDLTAAGKIDTKKAVRKLWETYPTKFEDAGEKILEIEVQSDGSNHTVSVPVGHVTRITFDKEKIRKVSTENNNIQLMNALEDGGESAIILTDSENLTVKNITNLRFKKIKETTDKHYNPSSDRSQRASSSPGNTFSSGFSTSSINSGRNSGNGLKAWSADYASFYDDPYNIAPVSPTYYSDHNSFAYYGAYRMGLDPTFRDLAAFAGIDPDDWEPLVDPTGGTITELMHCIGHFYNPDTFVGKAPDEFVKYAGQARDAGEICLTSQCTPAQFEDLAKKFGWADHYLTDVGNPMHTGREVDQAYDKKVVRWDTHGKYELDFVNANWKKNNVAGYGNFGDIVVDGNVQYYPMTNPALSIVNLAKFSHAYVDTLYYRVRNNPNGFQSDPTVNKITKNCIHASARYTNGFAYYVMDTGRYGPPGADFKYTVIAHDANSATIEFTSASHGATSYSWAFPDGSSAISPTVTKNFYTAGMKTVTLTVKNDYGEDSKSMEIPVGREPPIALFKAVPQEYPHVKFIAKTDSGINPESYPTSWYWDFGDLTNSGDITNPEITHSYLIPVTYIVTLTAKNIYGNGITYDTVRVPLPSVAKFVYSQTKKTVSFKAESNNASAWSWKFGDGGTSTERNPKHEYAKSGIYEVELTVQDGYWNNQDTQRQHINISDSLPLASFTSTPHAGSAPLTVRFTDTSTGNPTGWGWTFGDNSTINSTMQHPVHTYTANGTYSVSLWVTGAGGTNTTTRVNSICVGDCRDKVGIYRDGAWYLDNNGNGMYGAGDRNFAFGGAGWTPVIGDWASDGKSKGGVYKDGNWYLDYNGNGIWDAGDRNYGFGGVNWNPVIGDWNGAGSDKIGAYKDGAWYLDYDGSGTWTASDKNFAFGGAGWTPVVGKWTSDGKSKVGVYKDGVYYIDYSGDWAFGAGDKTVTYGTTGSTAVIGDWNANGLTEVGTLTGNQWKLDYDGSGAINASTKSYTFGAAGWNPVIGDWNGDGKDKIGIYQNGAWYLDYNGNGVWEGGTDKNYAFGSPGWLPVIGFW